MIRCLWRPGSLSRILLHRPNASTPGAGSEYSTVQIVTPADVMYQYYHHPYPRSGDYSFLQRCSWRVFKFLNQSSFSPSIHNSLFELTLTHLIITIKQSDLVSAWLLFADPVDQPLQTSLPIVMRRTRTIRFRNWPGLSCFRLTELLIRWYHLDLPIVPRSLYRQLQYRTPPIRNQQTMSKMKKSPVGLW